METTSIKPGLADLNIFDSNVTLGAFPGRCIASADDLLRLMDRYHIAEALVQDFHARSVYPLGDSNERLLRAIKGHIRLHPVWVLEPQPMCADTANVVVARMLDAGVHAARLRIPSMGALLFLWEELFTALEARRVPVFFDFGSINSTIGALTDVDVAFVWEAAGVFPRLPIILSHVMGGKGLHPAVVPMMAKRPNLHIDIGGILQYWREAAALAGPERVLFASGMPFTDPGVLISNVQYAHEVDDAAKKLICGDNLRRLIGGVI